MSPPPVCELAQFPIIFVITGHNGPTCHLTLKRVSAGSFGWVLLHSQQLKEVPDLAQTHSLYAVWRLRVEGSHNLVNNLNMFENQHLEKCYR